MPRDSNGNYTLPPGNPVVTGEVISTGWANPTMSDVGAELTNSLDRQGRGGMLAPFKFVDGTNGAPGMTWTNEPTTGFYRAGAGDMRATVAGVSRMRWTSSGVDVYDTVAGTWVALSDANGINAAILNRANVFTAEQTIKSGSPALRLWETDAGTDRGNWRWVADGGILYLQLRNDANDSSSVGIRVASTTPFGISSLNIGNTTSVTTLNLQAAQTNVGNGTYIPATAGATTVLGVYQSNVRTGPAVMGVYHADGTSNPRAELFADGTNFKIGLDWLFSSGVAEFEFRRAGQVVFSYDQSALRLRSQPSRAQRITWQADDNGMAFWNTDSGTQGFQWYLNSVLAATLNTGALQLGRDTTLNIRNASDYGITISSLVSPGGVYYANNATYPHHFQIDGNNAFSVSAGIIDFWSNKELRIWNAANSGYTLLQFLADTSGGNQLRFAGRGAVIHHNDPGYTGGGVVTSTSPAPATGTAGVIYFEVA